MTALQAASAGVKDMADGSLRITIEFEPRYAKDAFALFGARGTQVAIAALKDGSFLSQAAPVPDMVIPTTEPKTRAHMGDVCYRAVMWCQEPSFWAWANSVTHAGIFFYVNNKDDARAFVIELCKVDSRKELDTDNEANKTWHRLIREPYSRYLRSMEGATA